MSELMKTSKYVAMIKPYIQHHKLSRVIFLGGGRKIGLIHALHTYYSKRWVKQLKGGETKFRTYFDAHKKEYNQVLEMLSDEFSKETYRNVLKYRLTMNIRYLNKVIVKPQYFRKEIFTVSNPEVFIDGGAFIGDTVEEFLRCWSRNFEDKFYLWECEKENIKSMKKNLRGINFYNVPYAMWNGTTKLRFSAGMAGESQIVCNDKKGNYQGGIVSVLADSIDHVHGEDGMFPCAPTFIKMDIEGAEQHALEGAKNLIKKYKPKLAISIYHSDEDMWKIPLMIREMVPEYEFYIRHHSDMASETILYAKVKK